jgi:hypothetical protein
MHPIKFLRSYWYSQAHEMVIAGDVLCCLLVFRLECLAVATPRRVELHKPQVIASNHFVIKACTRQVDDPARRRVEAATSTGCSMKTMHVDHAQAMHA